MIYFYFKNDKNEWRWYLKAANGRIIAAAGEGYEAEEECLYDIELVKASSNSPVGKHQSVLADDCHCLERR